MSGSELAYLEAINVKSKVLRSLKQHLSISMRIMFTYTYHKGPVSPKYRPQLVRYLENILCTKGT